MSFVEIDARTREREWSMSKLQNHRYFEIYFLLKGTRRLVIDDRIFHISAPAVCVIPPYCMHKTEGEAYHRINVNVSADCLDEKELDFLHRLSQKAVFGLDKKADFLIEFLEQAAILSHTFADNHRLVSSIVSVILAFLSEHSLAPHSEEETNGSKDELLVMQTVAYIKQRFHKDFSLDELCKDLFVSKNSLCSKFRRVMNCSVMEYRSFLRISRAKELLESGRLSLGDVAERCGYSSANYFSLIFKKAVGISPMNYRKAK